MSSQSDCAVLPAFSGPQSDTDAFNTAEARIDFGPMGSPEKMFSSIIVQTPTCTTDLASEPSSSPATLDQPPSSQSTTNMETGDPKQSEVTMERDLEAGESHMNDTHGTPVSDISSQEMTEERESLERETNALASLSIITDEPMNSDREQSPVSESSATDTMAVVDALVPDSPLTPRSSTFSKQAPLEIPPIDLTPREDDNAETSSSEPSEGVQTPKPSNPQIPPTTRDTQSEEDVATPRAEMATPTRPRPSVMTPTTIDRELKSLSPTSNHLLGQLLATPERSPRRLPIHGSEDKQAGPSASRQMATMPFPRPPMSLETPQRTPRPFPSPLRSAKASSPVRPPPPEGAAESRSSNMPGPSTAKSIFARTGTDKLPPGSPLKSPVRRAVGLPATGLISPQKSIPSKIPATSARSNAATSKGVDKSSPVKGAESKIRANASKAALGASSTFSSTTVTKSLSRSTSTKPLPFPIGPVRTVPRRGTTSGTESSSDVEPMSSQPAKPEAPKSSLKQSASSKIPRPKPYARPAAATRRTLANRRAPDHERSSSNEDSTQVQTPATEPPRPEMPQEPTVLAPVPTPADPAPAAPVESPPEPAPPVIIQPLAEPAPLAPIEPLPEPAPPAPTEPLPEPTPPAPIQSSIFSAPSTLTANPTFTIAPLSPLKRKRPSEEASDTEIPPTTKSESRRQVKIPKLIEEETPAVTQPQPARLISRRQPAVTEPVRTLDEELAAAVASSDPPESDTPALPSSSPPSSSAELSNEEPRSDDRPLQSVNSSPDVPPIAAYPEVPRRTRTRRTLDLSGDGMGSSTARTARRRVGTHLIPPSDNFCGLSAIALKALTSQNTSRNEKYIMTKLETELVKKDGLRPDSPGIKAKTTLQRQQEELQKQREERAARRARRGGEGSDARQDLLDEVDEGDGISDEEEEESEMWDTTPSKQRHTRGAGDDEDYETPIRPSARRKGSGESDEDNDRRVRWDRGLFTEVYLDEVKFGTRKRDNLVASKGCLAPKAKALPLDNLGNLPDAASPWTDIEQEQVIIKRFVYENDESTAPVPEPVPVVKPVTRQRSKKAKS